MMEDFISASVQHFTEFLTKHKVTFKNNHNFLVSFAASADDINLKNKIDFLIKHHEKSFYMEKPSDDFLILALDEVFSISENGDKRFASTEKKIKELKNCFISNWENFDVHFPLFIGGMKFNVEHSREVWNDFTDSIWFVPEIVFFRSKSKKFLLYNFYCNSVNDNLINKFKTKLETILSAETNTAEEKVKINSIIGNSPKDKKKWKNLVSSALEKIYENEIKKIVLSRRIEILLSNELNFDFTLSEFKEKYPKCYLFFFHIGKSTFFGATPEKLAKFSENKIELDALAGSAPRGSNSEEDLIFENNLLNNEKDLQEHNFVIEHIKDSLSNLSEKINIQDKIKVRKLTNIQHLHTSIEAKVDQDNIPFGILRELFPTPAVCGFPKDVSLNLIKKLETHNRGLYSGIIGWFNFNFEGEFAITIRSALTFGNKLFAFAGSGIVEKSQPDLEFEETELKFKPILSLLNEN